MKWSVFILVILSAACKPSGNHEPVQMPTPPFLLEGNSNKTPTYDEGIAFWKAMEAYYPEVSVFEFGTTDAGLPLHLVVLGKSRYASLTEAADSSKNKLFINNAIHPGEPDGVDASMLLVHQILTEDPRRILLKNTNIFIIPFYNIGGTLNRNSTSRTNQNGPESYGFRGNAQNLDLNRDFVKCDSRNARSFAQLMQIVDPDLYIETHVSNGADYQYVITYLSTQEDKLGGVLGKALREEVTPYLNQQMTSKGYEMCPYVNVHGIAPDSGFTTFNDQPRYSTGYLTLHGIPAYITETHMLKPYDQRVNATLAFLQSGLHVVNGGTLKKLKAEHRQNTINQSEFALDWEIDLSVADTLQFKGYTFGYKPSAISGEPRMFYDRDKPFTKAVPYNHSMKSTKTIVAPTFYVLQRGFVDVEERLKENGVRMIELQRDTSFEVEIYTIDTFSTFAASYEKHYGHFNTKVNRSTEVKSFRKGDWIIPLDDHRKRFIVELLEPEAPDSYFNWDFFDGIIQQKEWYSSYVFEDEAAALLQSDTALFRKFNAKKAAEPAFASNGKYQLHWIFLQSNRYEKSHMRYPVYRVLKL